MLLDRTIFQFPQIRPAIAIAQPNALMGHLGGIDRSDLPYIYHHLRKGCILQLEPLLGIGQRHLLYKVNYGGFHLGILGRTLADRIVQLENESRPYRLTIANIVRDKYMPPTALQVELEW